MLIIRIVLIEGEVEGPMGHHCVLCPAAEVAESAGIGMLMQHRVICLLNATSGGSAGFEGLPIALVSFV